MTRRSRPPLLSLPSQWVAVGLAALLGYLVVAHVDLEPRVEKDFFFASDDPQLQAEKRIHERFGAAPQAFVAVHAPEIFSGEHLRRLHVLTRELVVLDGVASV